MTIEDILQWFRLLARVFQENCDYLTHLDAAIGDADHGINMARGFQALQAVLPAPAETDIGSLLKLAGSTLVSHVGGASGPLYGTAFLRAGSALAGKRELAPPDYLVLLASAVEGVRARGKAQPGEKTMLDALVPALEAARVAVAAHLNLARVARQASEAAETGMKATIPLVATRGRASYLGERSAGHQDPGATSSWLLLKSLAEVCAQRGEPL
ncbi:MAG TPA: dihydroxyacetone kinase subunit DhaL [Ktedonobacteraceae bacterium]